MDYSTNCWLVGKNLCLQNSINWFFFRWIYLKSAFPLNRYREITDNEVRRLGLIFIDLLCEEARQFLLSSIVSLVMCLSGHGSGGISWILRKTKFIATDLFSDFAHIVFLRLLPFSWRRIDLSNSFCFHKYLRSCFDYDLRDTHEGVVLIPHFVFGYIFQKLVRTDWLMNCVPSRTGLVLPCSVC